MREGRKWMRLFVTCLLAGSLALAGCSGDDGDAGLPGPAGRDGIDGTNGADGQNGQNGQDGQNGADAVITPLESCTACHGAGSIYDPNVDADKYAHDAAADVAVSNIAVAPAVNGTDLVVTFNVKVNGANKTNYDAISSDYRLDGPTMARRDLSTDLTPAAISGGASGNYTVTITGGATAYGAINSRYMLRIQNTAENALASALRPAGYRALVVFDYPAAPVPERLGSSTACADCHGPSGNGFHYGYPSYGGKVCVVCHEASNTSYPRLPMLIHGIHNSHNMPSGHFELNEEEVFSVTYPTYMQNCSVCHAQGASLDLVNANPVSFDFCMGCHENWTSFGDHTGILGGVNHNNFTAAINCSACHDGSIAPATVSGVHNGLMTERSGLIWNGQDVSVTEGARIVQKFDSIERVDDNLIIKWSATLDGAAVNPCNATVSATAPTWQSGFSILRAYAEGDDWTNAGIGTSPGQPVSTNLSFTGATPNTVCADNVATTTIALTANEIATTLTKGQVALQGKPQIKHTASNTTISVRAKTPTFEYNVADPSEPVAARREIVDTDACLKCHVGSLYQHGGNRIDNVDMCVMCHNEASNEQNVRTNDGVDATEAYDGKAGQTYGFKSLLHAVHSANSELNQGITMIYRTNGIYVWAPEGAVIPNWPGTGAQVVYGSNPAGTNPDGTVRNHNLHSTTYPRPLNDCAACHKPNTYDVPDQAISMATTVAAGAAPWSNQTDDVLMSTSSAACTSCHQSSGTRAHAYQNSWVPQTLENGRQSIIDAAR